MHTNRTFQNVKKVGHLREEIIRYFTQYPLFHVGENVSVAITYATGIVPITEDIKSKIVVDEFDVDMPEIVYEKDRAVKALIVDATAKSIEVEFMEPVKWRYCDESCHENKSKTPQIIEIPLYTRQTLQWNEVTGEYNGVWNATSSYGGVSIRLNPMQQQYKNGRTTLIQ